MNDDDGMEWDEERDIHILRWRRRWKMLHD